ncbi:hypothetical protein J6D24_00495 [Candidatus Saccharibacteria bacterium]|nr:hypothetical protein [Candidatus Saccharibacteria bacterium]
MGVIVNLFQVESAFLDKVCKNMMHDFHLKNALVGIFAVTFSDNKLICENIYQRNLTENPDGVDMEEYLDYVKMLTECLVNPEQTKARLAKVNDRIQTHCMKATHALCAIKPERGAQGMICIDVCVYEKNKVGVTDFAVAFAEALCGLRRNMYSVYGLKVGKETIFMKPAISLVAKAVSRWLSDDEEVQFWLKSYEPYDRGYFEEPNLSGMGEAMIHEMRYGIDKIVAETKRSGTLKLDFFLYDRQMEKAFSVVEDNSWAGITICFTLGEKTPISSGKDLAVKCVLYSTNDQNEQFCVMEVLATVLTDEVLSDMEQKRCMVELSKVLAKYAEVWRIVAKPKAYKLITGRC